MNWTLPTFHVRSFLIQPDVLEHIERLGANLAAADRDRDAVDAGTDSAATATSPATTAAAEAAAAGPGARR